MTERPNLSRLVLAAAVIAMLAARARAGVPGGDPDDADVPAQARFTAADVKRWMKVDARELNAADPEFRDLARQVAAGTTDVRVLRAYSRLALRLYPFDKEIPGDALDRAVAQKNAMAAREAGLTALPAIGCWNPLGPRNFPGRMTALALHPTDPNTIYAGGADGGVWKTSDLGATWAPLTDAQPVLSTGAIAIDPVNPRIVYWGSGEANYSGDGLRGFGLFKTTDGGLTWVKIPIAGLTSTRFHYLRIDPRDPTRLWAAMTAGLYRSTDSGLTWATVGGGLPVEDTTSFLISSKGGSKVMLAGIGRSGGTSANTGVWRSTDDGLTWTQLATPTPGGDNGRLEMAQSASNPNRVYVAIHSTTNSRGKAVLRSDDEGATFTPTANPNGANGPCSTQCWYGMPIAVDAGDPDVVYVGGVNIWKSADAGATWRATSDWTAPLDGSTYAHADHHNLVSPAPGVIWTANDGGISMSRDQGANWSLVGQRPETAQYYHISCDPTDENWCIAGAQDNGTQRFHGGSTWDKLLGGDGFYTAIDPVSPNIWYGSLYFVNLFRSADRGAGFAQIGAGIDPADNLPFITTFALDRANPQNVFALTQHLWKSVDRGDNFIDISGGNTFTTSYLTAVDNCPGAGDAIWIGTREGKVWETQDGGANWVDRSAGLPGRAITSVGVHPTLPTTAYVTVAGYNAGQHIYKTTNAGATWSDISAGLPDITFNRILVLDDSPNTLVVGADIGVYASLDAGATWGVLGSDLPNVAVDSLAYSPITGTLRAGTHGRGLWTLAPPKSCSLPPDFAGLQSITIDAASGCLPALHWNRGLATCPYSTRVTYNVYRSTAPIFAPGPATLLRAGLPEVQTTFIDDTALPGVAYFYVVRAEDGQFVFKGPSNGGKEDPNLSARRIEFGSPVKAGAFSDDGGDTAAWMTSSVWSVSGNANSTPSGKYAYSSAPLGSRFYTPDTCDALTTPDLTLGAAASLNYQASYNLEYQWDGVVVEISADGGATWADLPPIFGYVSDVSQTQGNGCGWPPSRRAFNGPPTNAALTPFTPYFSDLSAWAGKTVRIHWLFSTDAGAEFEGFFLDDVKVTPVVAAAAPGLGNVLLATRYGKLVRFTWADAPPVSVYRVYHATDRLWTDRAVTLTSDTGSAENIELTPRPSGIHYYGVQTVIDCSTEGP